MPYRFIYSISVRLLCRWVCTNSTGHVLFLMTNQGGNCRGEWGWTPPSPQFMSTDVHFWLKIGLKFQSLCKISNILTS